MAGGLVSNLRCRSCGERLVTSRWRGGLTHVARATAACEMDADHRPQPDWEAAGPLSCRGCDGRVSVRDGTLHHADGPPSDGHPVELLAI